MKISRTRYTATLLLFSLLTPQGYLFAAESAFNPNYLISDQEMQDQQSMIRDDIDAFLQEKGGYIATLRTPDKDGTVRTVADIIYRAAQEHRINPKYILVKLQKEQSLITDPNPTQKQLDGATGYGINDGCGWSCATYLANKGFGKQVDAAAGIMRWYYDHANSEPWIKKANAVYAIDDTRITPANNATAFLYTYTPHIQGNKNFWSLWQRWFEQVYPNGTLLQADDGETVYLIQNGTKRAFSNMTALTSRFNPGMIITVPASELARYSDATPITLPNYSILRQAGTYYLLAFDEIRPFESDSVVRDLGYNPGEIIDVQPADIAFMNRGKTIKVATAEALYGRLIRIKENNNLYFLDEGILHLLTEQEIAAINFPNLRVEPVSITDLPRPVMGNPVLFKDGTLLLPDGSSKVYVIENGKKRHIASEDVFNGLGYKWKNIIRTSEFTGLNHETGEPLYLRSDAPSDVPEATLAIQEIPVRVAPGTTVPLPANNTPDTSLGIENLMVRTPADQTTYIGERFETNIETYSIADAAGNVLAGKNINFVRPTASLAKVMTAYRLMQEGLPLGSTQTYDPADHKATYHRFRVDAGEKIRNRDLLDAMLVSSLNTPVRMLVDAVEEQESIFVNRMNDQAQAWGLLNTHFAGPSGENIDTVTTAQEYLTIYMRAVGNPTIKAVLGKKSYEYDEVLDLDGMPHHFDSHTNDLIKDPSLPFLIISSKTGYLYESGANMMMQVQRKTDGKEFYILTMGDVDHAHRFDETRRIAKWAMQTF